MNGRSSLFAAAIVAAMTLCLMLSFVGPVFAQTAFWIKYAGNPVLDSGPSGSWDYSQVWDPSVLLDGSVYKMWYTGASSDGLSTTMSTWVTLGQSGVPTVLIMVNQDLYPQIQGKIGLFQTDLWSEGYATVISLVSSLTAPIEVRKILQDQLANSNLKGAILIGSIKAAYSEIHTGDFSNPQAINVWISLDANDMYYADLDGQWESTTDPNLACSLEDRPSNVVEWNFYDSCQTFKNEYIVYPQSRHMKWDYPGQVQNKAQFQAEIWVSRIMTHNLAIPGKNEAQITNDYLDWNHAYRTGMRHVSSKAYILNTGSDPNDYNDQGMDYTTIFDTVVKQGAVTKSIYVGYLNDPGGSRLLYLTAHSWPQGHALSDTSLTVDELANTMKNSVFYILNACSACRWDQYVSTPSIPNYLGGVYVFDRSQGNTGNLGLGSMCFAGVGGFNNLHYFTDYLKLDPVASYGEAYKYWFNENLMINFGPTNYVYLGDPTLKAHVSTAFGSAIRMSTNTGASENPSIATAGSYVYVAWSDSTPVSGSSGQPEIWLRIRSNSGVSFGSAIRMSTNVGSSANPSIAASGSYVYIAWQDSTPVSGSGGRPEIWIRVSSNYGASFGSAIRMSTNAGNSYNPSVSADGSHVYVAWQDNTPVSGSGTGYEIWMRASSNNGATFNSPIRISTNTHDSVSPSVAASGNYAYVAWEDYTLVAGSGSQPEIWMRVSGNSGASFGSPIRLSSNAYMSLYPSVAASGNYVYVAWQDHTPVVGSGGAPEVWMRVSSNNGGSFGSAVRMSTNTGYSDYPRVAAAGSNVYVAWMDDTPVTGSGGDFEVWLRASANNGALFGSATRITTNTGSSVYPSVAAHGSVAYVAWEDSTPVSGSGTTPEIWLRVGS